MGSKGTPCYTNMSKNKNPFDEAIEYHRSQIGKATGAEVLLRLSYIEHYGLRLAIYRYLTFNEPVAIPEGAEELFTLIKQMFKQVVAEIPWRNQQISPFEGDVLILLDLMDRINLVGEEYGLRFKYNVGLTNDEITQFYESKESREFFCNTLFTSSAPLFYLC